MSFEALIGAAAGGVGRASGAMIRQYLRNKPGLTQLVEDGWEQRADGYWFYWRHEKDRMGRERVLEWGHGKRNQATWYCREYWRDGPSGQFFLLPRPWKGTWKSQVPFYNFRLSWPDFPPVYPEIEKLEGQRWRTWEGVPTYTKLGETSFGAVAIHGWGAPESTARGAMGFVCLLKASPGKWQLVVAIKKEEVTYPSEAGF